MKQHRTQILSASILAFLLAGCGGGAGSSPSAGNVVVPSDPTPSPTATPTPTSAGPTLLNFPGTKQFSTLESALQYNRPSSGPITLPDSGIDFSPSALIGLVSDGPAATRYYLFSGSTVNSPTMYSITFAPSSRVAALSDSAFTAYRSQSGGPTYTLTLLNPGPTNTKLALNYVGIGTAEATSTNVATGSVTTDFRAFGYGFPAEEAAVPKTGTGQYVGIVVGRAISVGGTAVYTLGGSLTLTTNFAAQSFTGSLTLTATDDRSGAVVALGSFPLASNVPYAIALNTIGAYIGSGRDPFRAVLAGSAAEELEGAFTLIIPDPRVVGGSLKLVGATAARR